MAALPMELFGQGWHIETDTPAIEHCEQQKGAFHGEV